MQDAGLVNAVHLPEFKAITQPAGRQENGTGRPVRVAAVLS
jgi:hypothetical protein